MRNILAAVACSLALAAAPAAPAATPEPSATRSLGDLLARSEGPVHIVFVHGMRAEGPGFSGKFREALCRRAGACKPDDPASKPLDIGEAPDLQYLGEPIWKEGEWPKSRPFVIRYVYRRENRPPIVLDEVNWWPLLFPLKCRFLVAPEADKLAGPNQEHLDLCAGRAKDPELAQLYHPWIAPAEADRLKAVRPPRGGAARVNLFLKTQIMNWGLADAVILLGPMRTHVRAAMTAAFNHAAEFEGQRNQQFVVISESLGSFAVLDALTAEDRGAEVRDVLARTADIYFFANQFALLELGRIAPPAQRPAPPAAGETALAGPAPRTTLKMLDDLAKAEVKLEGPGGPVRRRQIVAFSDPSDVLTYPVPPLRDAAGALIPVENVYVKTGIRYTPVIDIYDGLLTAHTRHSENRQVLDRLFRLTTTTDRKSR